MVRRTVSSTVLFLALLLMGGQPAQANRPLVRAVVSSLRNQVRLLPSRRPARKARLSDVLTPGDGIVTSRRSLAELRFNDGSLARMGEQAVFRFIPRTRSFRLSNGTVLMLIPPGQGRTQVRTPNVTAGIQGSALMIRYDKVTDTSTVIALTNSQISVTNRDQTQTQVLAAGQVVVTVGDEIVDSYDVDLQELYRTSQLLKDLEMDNPEAEVKDEAIAQVREETLEGLRSQRDFSEGEGRDGTEDFRLSELNIDSVIADETGRPFGTAMPGVDSIVDPASTGFPGRSIGVDGRFDDEDDDGEATVPAVTQPGGVEPPVTAIPEVAPQPPEALPGIVDPATIAEPPIAEPIGEVEQPTAGDPPDLEPVDPDVFPDDPIADNPVEDGAVGDDSPISGAEDLPADVPIFGDDTEALNPLTPEEDGVELPDDDLSSPDDDLVVEHTPEIETPDVELEIEFKPPDVETELDTPDTKFEIETSDVETELDISDVDGDFETPGLENELDAIDGETTELPTPDSSGVEIEIDLDVTVNVESDVEQLESDTVDLDSLQSSDMDNSLEAVETEDLGS